MDSEVSVTKVEAHEQAGADFAEALKQSFPSIAEEISKNSTLAFHGTIKGNDVVCTFEKLTDESPASSPKYSKHYDPTSPEVRERRKKLFEAILRDHTEESGRRLRELSIRYAGTNSL